MPTNVFAIHQEKHLFMAYNFGPLFDYVSTHFNNDWGAFAAFLESYSTEHLKYATELDQEDRNESYDTCKAFINTLYLLTKDELGSFMRSKVIER